MTEIISSTSFLFTEQMYVDEVEMEEEGIAELLDDTAIADVARPGTSLKKPGTGMGGTGPSPAVRPMSQSGRTTTWLSICLLYNLIILSYRFEEFIIRVPIRI